MDAAELITLVKRRHALEDALVQRTYLKSGSRDSLVDWLDDAMAAEREWIEAWDQQEEVRAVEAMGPRGERLVELTKRFPAPAGDWDQQEEPRAGVVRDLPKE